MSHVENTLKEATLYALALGCPRCTVVPDCPIKPIHHLPITARFQAVEALALEDKKRVLSQHEECLGTMSPRALRHGPFVEALLLLREIQKRIGTPHEEADDLEIAVRSAHDIRNHMARLMAEDDLAMD